MNSIQIQNVSKTYFLGETKIEALKNINLSIGRGEFTALIGTSGSGKSSLLNLIGCLDTPSGGKIFVDGEDTSSMSENQLSLLRNKKIGFVFQNFNLISVLDVFENVELPLLIQKNISHQERKSRVTDAIHAVGLEKFIHHPPDKLSGGQRQRVAVARAMVTQPSIILADEPTANLDSVTAHHIIDLLLDINSKFGVTFLFCTHDDKLIGKVKRVVQIKDGIISP